MTVAKRFNRFLENLNLTQNQKTDGTTKHTGVRSCLNSYYHGTVSGYSNSMLVGSWGKSTEIRPPRDIDLLFELPYSVYERYENKPWGTNKQSELLQEVKRVLQATYSTTKMRGDGQVVVVPFVSYAVEVVPAFKLNNGRFWICNTNNGGSYKEADPIAEQEAIKSSNSKTNNNTRDLIRMIKCWQGYCNVSIKSFWIEILAVDFLSTWEYAGKSSVYYDWMVKDFLGFILTKINNLIFAPGTFEIMHLGNSWESKARSAFERSKKACDYESEDEDFDAGYEWQKIFGEQIPLTT